MGLPKSSGRIDSHERAIHETSNGVLLWLSFVIAIGMSVAVGFGSGKTRLPLLALSSIAWLLVVALCARRIRKTTTVHTRSSHIEVDETGLSLIRRNGTVDQLITFRERYGVSVFTTVGRDRAALAITTPERTLCVGAALEQGEEQLDRPMLDQAVTLASEDLLQAALTPDGEALVVGSASLRQLFRVLTQRDGKALERCFLSDASGGQVVLDGTTLRAKSRTFDLSQPFEWRATVFRERAGQLDAAFQATWVKQEQEEVVLVALLNNEEFWTQSQVEGATSPNQIARSHNLEERNFEAPPPKGNRVAIDRLFMLPLRSAIDRAGQTRQSKEREASRH